MNVEANAVMTFRDETGREWLAGAFVDDLIRFEDGEEAERATAESLKDRAMVLTQFKIIRRQT